jgi:hypothetical protein
MVSRMNPQGYQVLDRQSSRVLSRRSSWTSNSSTVISSAIDAQSQASQCLPEHSCHLSRRRMRRVAHSTWLLSNWRCGSGFGGCSCTVFGRVGWRITPALRLHENCEMCRTLSIKMAMRAMSFGETPLGVVMGLNVALRRCTSRNVRSHLALEHAGLQRAGDAAQDMMPDSLGLEMYAPFECVLPLS